MNSVDPLIEVVRHVTQIKALGLTKSTVILITDDDFEALKKALDKDADKYRDGVSRKRFTLTEALLGTPVHRCPDIASIVAMAAAYKARGSRAVIINDEIFERRQRQLDEESEKK